MSNKKTGFIQKNINIPDSFEKDNKRDNIINWGNDNFYPYFLNFLYQNSAIQSGIVNSKVHYTTSGGLGYEGTDKEKFDIFFKNGNSDYNLDEVTEQMSKDLELSNMFCLKGLWSLDKSYCEKLEVIDFEKVRYRLSDDMISVSDDWSDTRNSTIKVIKPFDSGDRDSREFYLIFQEKSKQSITGRRVNKSTYPQPPYSGGITSILTDVKINKYQLNEISNGFSTGTIINLNNGIPTDIAEKREIEKDIKDNSTGEDNAGGTMILYNNGKDNEATVLSLTGNDLKDRYLALSQDNRNNIILAHSVTTPILFGIKTEGSLGNATELEIGYKIMKANYFKYKQRSILSALNHIAQRGNGLTGKIVFNEVNLDFIPEVVEEVVPEVPTVFEEDIDVISELKKCGIERPTNIIYSKSLPNEFDIDEEKAKLMEDFKKETFASLSAIENQVLAMLSDKNDYNSIRKSLGINAFKLTRIYKRLNTLGLIEGVKVTTNGMREIAKQDVSRIQIFYSYDLNPSITGPSILPNNRTRDFCKTLVGLSEFRVWSREDIQKISDRAKRNVFAYRGGWYNNPQTKKKSPWCRHIWKQEIVFS